jgi:transposase-like protein
MSKKIESKKLPTELVKIFVGSYDIKGEGCNEATLSELLEEKIEAILQARINYDLSYRRDDIKNITLQNDSPHGTLEYEYARIQDDELIDRNVYRTIIGYQRELQDLERKITFLFTEGMSIREISEYIQSLFDPDAQEYFVNSSK